MKKKAGIIWSRFILEIYFGNFKPADSARRRGDSRRRELARGTRTALGNSRRERFGENFLVESVDGLSDADGGAGFFARRNLRKIRLARIAEENRPRQFVRAADDGG